MLLVIDKLSVSENRWVSYARVGATEKRNRTRRRKGREIVSRYRHCSHSEKEAKEAAESCRGWRGLIIGYSLASLACGTGLKESWIAQRILVFVFTPWKVLIMPRWSGELRTRLGSLHEESPVAQNRMSHIHALVRLLRNGSKGRLVIVRYPTDLCHQRTHYHKKAYEWAPQDKESPLTNQRTCGSLHGLG
jgi:hypothetical protein